MRHLGKRLSEVNMAELERDAELQERISDFVWRRMPEGATLDEIMTAFASEGSEVVSDVVLALKHIRWIREKNGKFVSGNIVLASRSKKLECERCGITLQIEGQYHAGFGDQGYLYCSKDTTVLTFSSYDSTYTKLVGQRHPWVLAEEGMNKEMELVESRLVSCPCGGEFLFENPLKCPSCGGPICPPISRSIYYVVVDRVIEGEKANVWKQS